MRGAAARAIATAMLTAALLTACHREPSFDDRYASAQTALHSEAADIDSELAVRASEAAAADAVLGSGTPPPSR